MSHIIHCPHCGIDYEVESDQAGSEADCDACGKKFVLTEDGAKAVYTKKVAVKIKKPLHCPECESPSVKPGRAFNTCNKCGLQFTSNTESKNAHTDIPAAQERAPLGTPANPMPKVDLNPKRNEWEQTIHAPSQQPIIFPDSIKITDFDMPIASIFTFTFKVMIALILVNIVIFGITAIIFAMLGVSLSIFN